MARPDLPYFALGTTFRDLPPPVVEAARRHLLDLLGVAAAGTKTPVSTIISNHAAEHFGPGSHSASIMFDGRLVSPLGAALAGGMTIDSVDAHDGHKLTKGHVGCGLLPSLLAMAAVTGLQDGEEFLTRFVLGYEIATRAGIALHDTVDDYHSSGAWVALACAAMGVRALGLDETSLRHAVGIAEYHGPRSQMMRIVDHPTMLKDGSGWGAMAGVSAAFLARAGFTGAPAVTLEGENAHHIWQDLGDRWYMRDSYMKHWPVCRWAQPPVEAAVRLVREHGIDAEAIERVEVITFHESVRLAVREPADTEQAQYSLPWPVAAAIVRGGIGVDEISGAALNDPAIRRLSNSMLLKEDAAFNEAFPAKRIATVKLHLADGRVLASPPTEARGDPDTPFSDAEISDKFHAYASPILGVDRARALESAVSHIREQDAFAKLLELVSQPV